MSSGADRRCTKGGCPLKTQIPSILDLDKNEFGRKKEPCSHVARPARAVLGGRLFGIVFALTRRTFKLIDLLYTYIHREALLTKQSFLSYFDLLCVERAAHRGLEAPLGWMDRRFLFFGTLGLIFDKK